MALGLQGSLPRTAALKGLANGWQIKVKSFQAVLSCHCIFAVGERIPYSRSTLWHRCPTKLPH